MVVTPTEGTLRAALEAVNDPHVPASLAAMGMLQSVDCDRDGQVTVGVRMPCMACPGAARIVDEIETTLRAVEGVRSVDVRLDWSSDWERSMVAPQARVLMRRNGIQI